jgi:hypothetical protein
MTSFKRRMLIGTELIMLVLWTFPPDFIERLRKALLEINPQLAGAIGEGVDSPVADN